MQAELEAEKGERARAEEEVERLEATAAFLMSPAHHKGRMQLELALEAAQAEARQAADAAAAAQVHLAIYLSVYIYIYIYLPIYIHI